MKKIKAADDNPPFFSIVVPVYNEEKHIGSCLLSIFNSIYDGTQYEVIVVDNGSDDESLDIAKNSDARVFQLTTGNVGAVRNYGAKQARGKVLVFIDADCLLDRNWLNRAEKLIQDQPYCAYGGGAWLPEHPTWTEELWLLNKKGMPALPKHLIGASTMISKDLFLQLGGFNELISSGEDTDFHKKALYLKVPINISHELNVTHLGNAKNSIQFLMRQVWHSENYLHNLNSSAKDPIFLITVAFALSFTTSAFSILTLSFNTNLTISLFTFAILPSILSCKRIYRARYFTWNPRKILGIYILDLLYLIGRSIGLIKGLRIINR
ncbi:glycosyltransferase [uncultured Marinobacter sp.]|uniref:glycosyltransferase n=1 Tax=uncultured Marinobacter sp. TaxID=187379 RepID=UPI002603614E|nr:glycosyltransferase [uncultured Marinobacter sp.]